MGEDLGTSRAPGENQGPFEDLERKQKMAVSVSSITIVNVIGQCLELPISVLMELSISYSIQYQYSWRQ